MRRCFAFLVLLALVLAPWLALRDAGAGSIQRRTVGGLPPLAPLDLSSSVWPSGTNARYDWAFTARTNGTTHATWIADLTMPASNLPNAGLVHGRDTTSAQRHMQVTINTVGAVVVAISPAIASAYATCTTAAGTMALSTRTRVAFRYEGPALTNAARLRVWTCVADANGFCGAIVEQACTFAGTIPSAWSNDVTTAPWSIGQQFNGTLPLRSVALHQLALWSGIALDPADTLAEVMRARNLTATSLGAPTLHYTFSGSTITETTFQGAGGLIGSPGPTALTVQAMRHRTNTIATPGCGQAANVTTASTSETFQFALNGNSQPRSMLVVKPSLYDSSRRYPVVLRFHGCSGTVAGRRTEDLGALSGGFEGALATADGRTGGGTSRAIIVYLQGQAGPRGGEIECPTVSDFGWTSTQTSTNTDMLFAQRAVDVLDHRYCIDRTRIYAEGQSMGGAFVNAWAGYQPTYLRAAATLVSVYRIGTTLAAPLPVIQTGNLADNVATFAGTPLVVNANNDWITRNGSSSPVTVGGVDQCVSYTTSTGVPHWYCLNTGVGFNTHSPSNNAPGGARGAVANFFINQAGL